MNDFYTCPDFIPPRRTDYGSDEHYQEAVRVNEIRLTEYAAGRYEYLKNDVYAVQVHRGPNCLCFSEKNAGKTKEEGNHHHDWPEMVWLSIKRIDREPIVSWRDMQEIKNKIMGPEYEAVQIFPAESRLVDTSNQYHLLCFADEGVRWPFGYLEREVMDRDEAAMRGAKQQ